jgi:hypothetical protein
LLIPLHIDSFTANIKEPKIILPLDKTTNCLTCEEWALATKHGKWQ